jgi:hypothetical protein
MGGPTLVYSSYEENPTHLRRKEFLMSINPGLKLDAFAVRSPDAAPPPINALYLRDGRYDGMTRSDVTATFAAFRAQTLTNRFALFFHGGLVDKVSGQQAAANQFLKYRGDAFPLFFIWESGFGEVLSHHLPLIFAETIFGRVLFHATAVLGPKFPTEAVDSAAESGMAKSDVTVSRSIAATTADIDVFMRAIQSDPQIQNEAVAIARASRGVEALLAQPAAPSTRLILSPRTLMSPEVVSSIRGAYTQANHSSLATAESLDSLPSGLAGGLQAAWAIAKASVPIIVNVIRRFAAGRDHALHCTIVEELLRALYLANFGSAVWEEMEKETADAFGSDSNTFGGTAVIEELCNLVHDKPGTTFTLIGHSAGAVYVSNFLKHVDQALTATGDATTNFDIVLLAPANATDSYAETYTKRIRGLRMFQMKDATEQEDHLLSDGTPASDDSFLGKIYPRSLLYLVAGVCEYVQGHDAEAPHDLDGFDMPILGMDRYFEQTEIFESADYASLDLIRTQFPTPSATKYARILSPTDTENPPPIGFRCGSLKHGNFPGDPETIQSIQTILQHGI